MFAKKLKTIDLYKLMLPKCQFLKILVKINPHEIIKIFFYIYFTPRYNPADNYMLKVSNRNTRTKCEIFSKLTIKTSERSHGPIEPWHTLLRIITDRSKSFHAMCITKTALSGIRKPIFFFSKSKLLVWSLKHFCTVIKNNLKTACLLVT